LFLAASSEAEFRVPIFTHVKAFSSDKKWTHIKGVKHIVARTDDGTFLRHTEWALKNRNFAVFWRKNLRKFKKGIY
jgi:hypothetical protein